MTRRTHLLLALAAAATTWFAVAAWRPLYAEPGRFLAPAALVFVLSVAMAFVRSRGVPVVTVIAIEIVLAIVVLVGHQVAVDPAHWSSIGRIGSDIASGSRHLDDYSSPAPGRFHDVASLLFACALLLWLVVETIGCTLRRATLVGFPLLLALTVPITVLDGRLPVWVLTGCLAGYLLMIACGHALQTGAWGRRITADSTSATGVLPGIALVAVALGCALAFSAVMPLGRGISHEQGGHRPGANLDLGSPMLDLHRDLLQRTHTPMVTASTDDPDPSYLTLTVLDQFTGNQWRASPRLLPPTNSVNGNIPGAPGLSPTQPGDNTQWAFTLAPTLRTRWLPIPTPLVQLRVSGGDWRYDARTLDIADVSAEGSSGGLSYTALAFQPDFSAQMLNDVGPPIGDPTDGMTDLPKNLPPVIARTAKQVTKGTSTELNRLIALQQWFRETGGFRYSTAPGPGSGMALLARFITTDKVGYCEQFAAAMAVMGRTLGIPSRVVVGFLRPTGKPPSRGTVEFTSDDLHAWPEFYFAGAGWIRFDPTPGSRTGAAPAYARHLVRHQDNQPQPTKTPEPTRQPTHAPTPKPRTDQTASADKGHHGVPWWLVVPVLLIAAGAVPSGVRRAQRRRRLHHGDAHAFAVGCWEELRASAVDLGLVWPEHGTIRSTLLEIRSLSSEPDAGRDLLWLAALLERAWYAPTMEITADERSRAIGVVDTWRQAMAMAVAPRAAQRARWLPASITDRSRVLPPSAEREPATAGKR